MLAVVLRGDEHGELQRAAEAPEGEGAAQKMVRCAVGAGGDPLGGGGDELGGGMVPGVEEIGGAQVREEQGVHRQVAEVFIGDARHVDGEAGARELALAQEDFTGGEPHGPAVVIEEIAAGPADDALGGIDAEGAIGHGRLREVAGAFEGQAGGGPFGEAALERLDVGVAGGAEFFCGGGSVERALARAIDDDGSGGVGDERPDLIEKGHLIDARVLRTGDASGGEDFRREQLEELRGTGGLEPGLEFAGGHGAGGRMTGE